MSKAVFGVQESCLPQTFEAASVKPATNACGEAREMRGKRYLIQDVPSLPLSGCSNSAKCACRYEYWEDRRQDEDRRSAYHGIAEHYAASERRSGRDRRRSG